MRKTRAKVMLDKKERKCANELLKNFLVVMVLTIVIEAVVRIFLSRMYKADEWRWLEWLLVSLIGVCAYLVWTIATWYHRPDAQFQVYTPWYWATAFRGPIIALVILLALTNISFRVELPAVQQREEPSVAATQEGESETAVPATFDFGIDFRRASDEILLVVAFLLGFYSRLAKSLLGRITRFIFGGVYQETYGKEEQGVKESEQTGGEDEQAEQEENLQPEQTVPEEGQEPEQVPPEEGQEPEQVPPEEGQEPEQVTPEEGQEPEQVMPEEDQEPK